MLVFIIYFFNNLKWGNIFIMFFRGPGEMIAIALIYAYFAKIGGCIYAGSASVDMDMDIYGKFHIHGKPA